MNPKLITGVLAVAAIALSTSACQSNATPSPAQSASGMSGAMASSGAPSGAGGGQRVTLQGMPVGTVTVTSASNGRFQAHVVVTGLTPGSSHDAAIDAPNSGASTHVVRFPSFTADATGGADATLTSLNTVSNLSAGDRFTIRLGASGGTGGTASVATEVIAQSDVLPTSSSATPLPLQAVDIDAGGHSLGHLGGSATLAFNSAAHTLTVTVNATGLTPGAHAAHIHLGSCE